MPAISERTTNLLAGAILIFALATSAEALILGTQAAGDLAAGTSGAFDLVRPGYALDSSKEVVVDVTRGGPAWSAGLRPGWRVDPAFGLGAGEPGAISACGGVVCRNYVDRQGAGALAERRPFDIFAGAMAIVGLLFVRRRPRAAGLLGLAALVVSSPTYAATGWAPLFPALYLAPLVGTPLWLALVDRRRLSQVAVGAAALLGAAWAIAWLSLPGAYDNLESVRLWFTSAVLVAGLVVQAGWLGLVDEGPWRDRRIDAVICAAIGASAVAARTFGGIGDGLAVSLAAAAVLGYFGFRSRNRGLFVRMAFAERRQQATLRALEEERSRLARDIHDVPLQEVSAIIRQLGNRKDVEAELGQLREVARHLREVSVSLRPPVLDDVGLGAALTELLGRPTPEGLVRVELSLEDRTSIEVDTRPPPEVELAVYRIVQEAVANAQRHAGASRVIVSGLVDQHELLVSVADNGSGIDQRALARGERADKLGMASMRERAEAIEASLTVAGGRDGGTVVAVRWADRP